MFLQIVMIFCFYLKKISSFLCIINILAFTYIQGESTAVILKFELMHAPMTATGLVHVSLSPLEIIYCVKETKHIQKNGLSQMQ